MEQRYCPNCYDPISERQHAQGVCPNCGKALPTLMISLPKARPEPEAAPRREEELPLPRSIYRESRGVAGPAPRKLLQWGSFRMILLLFAFYLILAIGVNLFASLEISGRTWSRKTVLMVQAILIFSLQVAWLCYFMACLLIVTGPSTHGVRGWGSISFTGAMLLFLVPLIQSFGSGRLSGGIGMGGMLSMNFSLMGLRGFNTFFWLMLIGTFLTLLGFGLAMAQSAVAFRRRGLGTAILIQTILSLLIVLLFLLLYWRATATRSFSSVRDIRNLLRALVFVEIGLKIWGLSMVLVLRGIVRNNLASAP